MLQPKKKWTPTKEKYWTNDCEPIPCILAKLTGGGATF